MMMPIEIYTDGSCLGNPGPAGLGWIIRYWKEETPGSMPKAVEFEGKVGFRFSTNNRMEIMAGIYGIEEVQRKILNGEFSTKTVTLLSDSQYFVDAVSKRWIDKWKTNGWVTSTQSPVKNRDLWERVSNLLNDCVTKGINITLKHVHGHNGNEFNERADRLAVSASNDSSNYQIDEVYEKDLNNRRNNFNK